MSVMQSNAVQIKKTVEVVVLMIFFLTAIRINNLMLTQAIIAYTTGNDFLAGTAAGYGVNSVIPIIADWAGVIAENGGTLGEIAAGALIGAAMSDPLTLGIFAGLVATS
ncbi:hypothetical protein J5U21_01941 [Saccharolobus shibatae]|uniref:Uncharacterized protein n=2 Tax=Saccharolobus shibatae TaxID=2286 RepID=A0A8F5BVT3_9CREN|nr:hypothetical protein J5U21_01941 [Saccharolobus shibatae]